MTVRHDHATAAARDSHPIIRHGGIIFLGRILLVVPVPLLDRGEGRCPVQMFTLAIAISALTVLLPGHRRPPWHWRSSADWPSRDCCSAATRRTCAWRARSC